MSYEASGLARLGPKNESSPTKQLLEGPTFRTLASGGVHTVVRPALR
jgi:hypothetical protein